MQGIRILQHEVKSNLNDKKSQAIEKQNTFLKAFSKASKI